MISGNLLNQENKITRTCTLFDKLAEISLFFYILSLYIFVNREQYLFISQVFFVMFAGSMCAGFLLGKPIKVGFYNKIFLCFIFWSALTYIWAVNKSEALQGVNTLIQICIMSLLVYNYIDDIEKINKIFKYIILSGTIMCIYMLLLYGMDTLGQIAASEGEIRLGGIISHVNIMGMQASTSTILCVYMIIYKRKYLYLACLPINFIFAMLSGSRKAILCIVIAILLLSYLKTQKNKLVYTLISVLAICAIFYLISCIPMFHVIHDRFNSMLSFANRGQTDDSTKVRSYMINLGISAFKDNPMIGYGMEGYSNKFLTYFELKTYSHCNYIELLVNTGVIGFLLYYLIYGISIVKLIPYIKKGKPVAVMCFVLIIIYLILEIGLIDFKDKLWHIILAAICACATLAKDKETEEYKKEIVRE